MAATAYSTPAPSGVSVFLVDMAEIALGRHFVPHQLLQFFDLWKASMALSSSPMLL
jgi:hypothetical protein